jgi:outer membrane protein FlgP
VLVSITPVGDDTYETTMSLDRNVVNDLRVLYIASLSNKR